MFGNDLFEQLYDHWIRLFPVGLPMSNKVLRPSKRGCLQLAVDLGGPAGDFNPNQSAGQIAANAVLGLIP